MASRRRSIASTPSMRPHASLRVSWLSRGSFATMSVPHRFREEHDHEGDCRAVLCRQGAAVRLSEDHKPNRRDEKARIEKAGGHVVEIGGIHRVCTAASKAGLKLVEDDESLYLAVSRAFGDRKLKSPSSTKTSQPLVSATPEDAANWRTGEVSAAPPGSWISASPRSTHSRSGGCAGARGAATLASAARSTLRSVSAIEKSCGQRPLERSRNRQDRT